MKIANKKDLSFTIKVWYNGYMWHTKVIVCVQDEMN